MGCVGNPARKLGIGNKLYFGEKMKVLLQRLLIIQLRGRTLRFLFDGPYDEFRNKLQELGETPLPKYINRPVRPQDKDRFQTIYAKNEGAVCKHLQQDFISQNIYLKIGD